MQAMSRTVNNAPLRVNEWQTLTLFLITAGSLVLCWLIARPFVTALAGAIVLAVITTRPYEWLKRKLRRPSLAAALALVLVTLSIIGPGVVLVQQLSKHAMAAASVLRNGGAERKTTALLDRHPKIAAAVDNASDQLKLRQAGESSAGWVAAHLASVLSNSVSAITQLGIMLFVLFFLYRDRELALAALRSLLPLTTVESDRLLGRVEDTIYATVLGRMLVAIVQGLLAGLAFWVLRVPGALLWAIMTAVVAMIPAFGAFLIWVPVSLYLALTGHVWKALLLVAWGGLFVSTIDNFLYPAVVGSRLQMHTVPILLSVLGGIALMGLPGVVLGPIILTVAQTLLSIWHERGVAQVADGRERNTV